MLYPLRWSLIFLSMPSYFVPYDELSSYSLDLYDYIRGGRSERFLQSILHFEKLYYTDVTEVPEALELIYKEY